MHELDEIRASISRVEKHIEFQDIEVYRHQRTIDGLRAQVKKLEERVEALEEGGGAGTMPADEKPPHY
ncbi:MAG: SlyX family protein [Opitutales bacterium]